VTEKDLRLDLQTAPVPDELEAQRRAWAVVGPSYAVREPVSRRARRLRPVIALAVVAALVAAALSPPGRAVGDWIRDRVAGKEDAEPALVRLPAPGQLLVLSERGPWIVRPDGSKRLLGDYEGASFSPNGLFVVATDGRRVVALEPGGEPRWSLSRPSPVADARWAPTPGFRVAYREGATLRVVDGDGTDDRLLARGVAPIAPAWLPREGRTVLAYADAAGRVHVVEADSGEELWSARPAAEPEKLVWSPDGRLLLVVTAGSRHPLYRQGGRAARELETRAGHDVLDAELAPGTGEVAHSSFDPETGRSAIVVSGERVQSVEGRIEDLVYSPDGRRLLAGWPDADQLLFLPLGDARGLVAVDDVRREFAPGSGAGAFPRVAEWCCPARG
jgi:hypothetical protein